MIIINATVTPQYKQGGGTDDVTGNPIPFVISYGKPIPCHFQIANKNKLAETSQGNKFTAQQYEVLIEHQKFEAERLKLVDCYGRLLGVFSVVMVEALPHVDALKIILANGD